MTREELINMVWYLKGKQRELENTVSELHIKTTIEIIENEILIMEGN